MEILTNTNASRDLRVTPRQLPPSGRFSTLELLGRTKLRRNRVANDRQS